MLLNKRRITAISILGFIILGLIGFRIFDFLLPKTDEELLQAEIINNEITENTILVLSDGSINEDNTTFKKHTLRYLTECDGYKYSEKIIKNGLLASVSISPLLVYEEGFSSYEYVIISGGFCDFLMQLEIGEFGAENTGLCKVATDFFNECSKKSPNTTYILTGIPYFEEINSADRITEAKYTIADYNLALKMIADKYDNVQFLDFAEKTYKNPATVSGQDYLYDIDTLNVLYDSFKNKINN